MNNFCTSFALKGSASKHWPRPQRPKPDDVVALEAALKQLSGEQLDKASYQKRLNQLLAAQRGEP
jgi:hypothetical protein